MRIPVAARRLRSGELVELRSPEGSDAPAVLAHVHALARSAWRNMTHPPEFYERITEEAEVAFLESCAAHPRGFFVAAFHEGRVLGAANVRLDAATFAPHCGELGLGVDEAYRGKGLGRVLMETLIENADRNGIWNLTLRVRAFNAPAIALYESLGFRLVGTLRNVVQLPDGLFDERLYQREGTRPLP